MSQAYSRIEDQADPWKLPDIEVFQLPAREVAETMEDEMFEFMRRREFRLANMNSKTREAMFDAMVDELAIEGGWFYWYCFPGCMPESSPFGPFGPFASHAEALQDARENAGE